LSDATAFTTLDAFCGHCSVSLHENSRALTTFITLIWHYCFKSLQFGTFCASKKFQRIINNLLKSNGTIACQDDILIFGKTTEKHNNVKCQM